MINKAKILFRKVISVFLGANASARFQGVVFGKNCQFGKNNKFMSEPYLIRIGDNFSSSSNVNFVTHDGSMRVLRILYPECKQSDLFGKITIGNNVFIGVNTTILPNTVIEDNVIVGAGSIVKGTLQANGVFAGIPVKYICSVEEYMLKNKPFFEPTKHLDAIAKREYLLAKYDIEN